MAGNSKNKGKPNSIQVKLASRHQREPNERNELTEPNELDKPTGSNEPIEPDESAERLAEETKDLKGTLLFLSDKLERLSIDMEKAQLKEYVNLMHRPWQLIFKNFIAGTARGVGIALGFTFFAATIVYLLQLLGALNLPIVGDYIADIVRIVQRQLEINPY